MKDADPMVKSRKYSLLLFMITGKISSNRTSSVRPDLSSWQMASSSIPCSEERNGSLTSGAQKATAARGSCWCLARPSRTRPGLLSRKHGRLAALAASARHLEEPCCWHSASVDDTKVYHASVNIANIQQKITFTSTFKLGLV